MGEGAPDASSGSRPARRGRAAAQPPPPADGPGEHRLAAAAGDRRRRASATTARCGRRPPRPPAAPATPTPWSARPETVAAALLDYYDLGVDILSARGYDLLDDAIEFGRQVIPIVREEVAKRDATRVAA